MREWRRRHPYADLPEETKRRIRARAYANVYKRRGKLKQGPCEMCGSPDSQMHHYDYDKPLDVRWLCRPCHLWVHPTH